MDNFEKVESDFSPMSKYVVSKIVGQAIKFVIYHKVPKFSDARNFAVINLKFKQRGKTWRYFVKNMRME